MREQVAIIWITYVVCTIVVPDAQFGESDPNSTSCNFRKAPGGNWTHNLLLYGLFRYHAVALPLSYWGIIIRRSCRRHCLP